MKIAIYVRTSTEEQEPQNQIRDCETLRDKLGINKSVLFQDKISGWKDIQREGFDAMRNEISKGQINCVICWDLDRLFRNRKRLIAFFQFCQMYNCKIYSYRQKWLEDLNKIPTPFNEIMHGLMIQIMGWLAEEESSKKSDRVKLAVRKKEGITLSYKGNKWGRKNLPEEAINQINALHLQGKSLRDISKLVSYKINKKVKYVSLGAVHKIISDSTQGKMEKEAVQ